MGGTVFVMWTTFVMILIEAKGISSGGQLWILGVILLGLGWCLAAAITNGMK